MQYIFAFAILITFFAGCTVDMRRPVKSSAPVEKKFFERGSSPVLKKRYPDKPAIHIWYPRELNVSRNRFPVIILCNGTGFPASRNPHFFEHLASWGFIAAGCDETWSGKGNGALQIFQKLRKLDNDPASVFYRKIDFSNIGIAGYSQGGAGVFNACARAKGKFKAAFIISGINRKLAESPAMQASYDPAAAAIPVMMTATSSKNGLDAAAPEHDSDGICDISSMRQNRDIIRKHHRVPVIIARAADRKLHHGDSPRESLGYLTAWFIFYLKGDRSANFHDEICRNDRWQDVEISL